MGRRRLVVLLSGLAMLILGVGVVGSLVVATQSDGGRDWIRRQLERELARGVRGRLHLGTLSGSFLTDLALDSLLITDPDDSVFIATGRLHFTYDPRDIFDGRVIVRSALVQHPFVVVRRGIDDRWNFRNVFPVEAEKPGAPAEARRAFGALVVFRNVRVRGGHLQLTLPWQPDDSLRGTRRDSAVVANLAVPENEIRRAVLRGRRGLQRTWHWTDWTATLDRIRVRFPDSSGRRFDVARMGVLEHAPPFAFRNMRGTVLWRGDSIWLDFPHFELPSSTARAAGKVVWGSDLPIRYDVRIHGDVVAMEDIAWIYRTLPRTGGGSMDLHIRNERHLSILDYAITNMDARVGQSHVRGAMTYGVGGPVLIVKDLNLELAPVDFELLETLHGGRFPLPWRGTFAGILRGPGGPLNHLRLAEAALRFTDGNVPGAVAEGSGRGELDVLDPGSTRFHGFQVELSRFDLRTAQFVNVDFPRLNGIISGTALLDSVWNDVRLQNMDITHRDGDAGQASRVTGGGRVTSGDANVGVDLSLVAHPLSMDAIARSYAGLPLRGEFSGPLEVRGTIADLNVNGDLLSEAGRLKVDGLFGTRASGINVTAVGSVSRFDLRRALKRSGVPATDVDGRFDVNLEGDSPETLAGTARLLLGRSVVAGLQVDSAQAALRFLTGAVRVDSSRVAATAGLLTASGGLGITPARGDTLRFEAQIDSLGGLRHYFAPVLQTSTAALSRVTPGAREGGLRVTGVLAGIVSRFSLDASVSGSDLSDASTTVRSLTAAAHVEELPNSGFGSLSLRLDTLAAGPVTLSRVLARLQLLDQRHGVATVAATTMQGARIRADADVERRGDTTTVRLDSLALRTSGNAWTLARPVSINLSGGGLDVDSLAMRGERGGTVLVRARAPSDSSLSLALDVDTLPLADVSDVARTASPLGGTLSLHAAFGGWRARPEIAFSADVRRGVVAGLRLDLMTASGRYADRRLATSVAYGQAGVSALRLEATLPLDLAWDAAASRLLEEPLAGRLRSDSAGLTVIETLSNSVINATGSLAFDLGLSGTWRHPRLTGSLRVRDGAMSLAPMGEARVSSLDANVEFFGDSIALRHVAARSGAGRNAGAELSGFLSMRDLRNPQFDLRLSAQGFNIVKRQKLADLDLTGDLRLRGSYGSATLTGALTVDRGTIYAPELYQRRVISLDDPELYRVADTSALVDRSIVPSAPALFVDNLTVAGVPVRMGRDVWMKSAEANINLGGLVSITRGRVQRGPRTGQVQLALEGPLQTIRGTYRLNLGPVQRTFTVESGEMRFYGDPDLDATLNINAVHTVRQFSQQGARPDVRVRVHIGGTLLSPTAELSSPDSLRVTNADLISYLVTGGPSYEIAGRNGDYASTAARVLLASSFSVLAGQATGRLCDDAQLSAAGVLEGYQGRIRDVSGSILSGTRFNCAKQLSEKTFVRLDYGFCQVGQLLGGVSASDLSLTDALGVKLEYRLTDSYTASIGTDPSTSALLCARDANARGFAPAPRQLGFDVFRFWRF